MDNEKEVMMDVKESRRKRRTRKSKSEDTVVEKDTDKVKSSPETQVEAKPVIQVKPVEPKLQKLKPQTLILAPAKKAPKVMLVPKEQKKVIAPRKTFKVRNLKVVIDNTAKTQKRRRKVLADIDSMSEETLRETAVNAKLSRAETVAKVPLPLLRQLLKDYRMLRGLLV